MCAPVQRRHLIRDGRTGNPSLFLFVALSPSRFLTAEQQRELRDGIRVFTTALETYSPTNVEILAIFGVTMRERA